MIMIMIIIIIIQARSLDVLKKCIKVVCRQLNASVYQRLDLNLHFLFQCTILSNV